jgi:transposase InsO family protein
MHTLSKVEARAEVKLVRAIAAVAINGWDPMPLRREQLADPNVGPILQEVETGQRPEWKDIANLIASRGPRMRNLGQMRQYNIGAPFERIAINVAGPFPRSNQGNRYLLIAMDYFTKWPEAYAIPNQEAATVAEALVINFFCRFGVPRELHNDQGRNFESHLMQEVLQCLGVKNTRTTPLHPQSKGMVERYIKTVEEHLRKVVALHQRDCDARLPIFLLAYRASTHDTTGLTPANLVFQRELRLPCNLLSITLKQQGGKEA